MSKVSVDFSNHFTDKDKSQNDSKKLAQEELRKLKSEQEEALSEIEDKKEQNTIEEATSEDKDEVDVGSFGGLLRGAGGASAWLSGIKSGLADKDRASKKDAIKNSGASDALEEEADVIRAESAKAQEAIGAAIQASNRETNYSESNRTASNVYNINMTKKDFNGSEIICKPEDTINRINSMKAGIMFQPAFFSGDKVDFIRKVEFLSKLTRPSAAPDQPNTGFSFTKPPISHIKLGDWWDHDIVVNSVSYDYADAPWTLEGGRVQPMWVLVSINFNIIGPYGISGGKPPLSNDNGGMYSPIS
jgi:hypothetical protein